MRNNSLKEQLKQERTSWVDAARGVAVISMILYHALWDLIYLYGEESGFVKYKTWYEAAPGYLWQQSICWSFILLSGYSQRYSKHPFRRGGLVLFCGWLISFVTGFAMPDAQIRFGILTFMGFAMLLFGIWRIPEKYIAEKKGFPFAAVIVSALLFLGTRNVNRHSLGFESLSFGHIPVQFYANSLTAFWGFPPKGFVSTDYFSVIPWIFLFAVGYWMHYLGAGVRLPQSLIIPTRALQFLGRHTLPIYLLHQVVLYLLFQIVFVGFFR